MLFESKHAGEVVRPPGVNVVHVGVSSGCDY